VSVSTNTSPRIMAARTPPAAPGFRAMPSQAAAAIRPCPKPPPNAATATPNPIAITIVVVLMAGLAAHDAIKCQAGIEPDLRWPNDIMLGEKKLGGILTELSTEAGKVRHVVVGIGLNVNHDSFPEELRDTATSLRLETDRDWPRIELAAALLKLLDREYRGLQSDVGGKYRDAVVDRFEQCSSYARSAHVHVDDSAGDGAGYTGQTAGLDSKGFLLVQTSGGLRTVINGGVRKVKPEKR